MMHFSFRLKFQPKALGINTFIHIAMVVLNSFVSKRPFFANIKVTFANLLRIHRRALFISQVRELQLFSASVVREMRFPNSSCKVATFHHGGSA